tara:strand:- start:107 stop:553 length:447 start_codon:yes stop_codon:yes gene_type:complete
MLVEDRLVELATGTTGTPADTADAGFIIERGGLSNVFMGWDEDDNKFKLSTTTSTGGDNTVTHTGYAGLLVGLVEPKAMMFQSYDYTSDSAELNAMVGSISGGSLDGRVFYLATAPTSGTAYDAGMNQSDKFYFIEGGVLYPSPFTNS